MGKSELTVKNSEQVKCRGRKGVGYGTVLVMVRCWCCEEITDNWSCKLRVKGQHGYVRGGVVYRPMVTSLLYGEGQ